MIADPTRPRLGPPRGRPRRALLPAALLAAALLPAPTGGRASPPGPVAGPAARAAEPVLERAMRERVLRDRRAAGRGPLAWDPALAAIARDHSRDMVRRGYLGHVSPDGDGP
ncbi:MAG TPA: CAP domain-containing protein, partial [Gemmatimonadota bacterium]|nr:CAP domain-containing protein [Gemmatimonadota bacterium]